MKVLRAIVNRIAPEVTPTVTLAFTDSDFSFVLPLDKAKDLRRWLDNAISELEDGRPLEFETEPE